MKYPNKVDANVQHELNERSLKRNMVLNAVKGLSSVLFPLISFPYVSRILGVEQLGKYNFANSVISIFSLLAGLGFASYSRREGAKIRNDRNGFSHFASEMFSANLITTFFAYLLLFTCLFFSSKLSSYTQLLLINSVTILLQTIGVDWVYSVFEDYAYITIRTIAFQAFSMLFLFIFVKSPLDLYKYMWIWVFSSAGSNVMNFFHASKYCDLRFTFAINWKKHFIPILTLFATTLSVTIYVSSDMTILGLLCGDHEVGLYSVSVKIYTALKNILASVITVSIPRLCAYIGEGRSKDFQDTAYDVYTTVITVTFPVFIGIFIFSREIILLVAGSEYLEAERSLRLLSICIICYMFSYFWGQCILVPQGKERFVLIATLVSACINLILNFALIPYFKQDAAAFTSILGEGVAMAASMAYGKRFCKFRGTGRVMVKTILGCTYIVLVSYAISEIIQNLYIRLMVSIIVSAIGYFAIELFLKNEAVYSIYKKICTRYLKR